MPVCIPKSLTSDQQELAVRRSIEINPANASKLRMIERTPTGRRRGPRRLALVVGNRWPETGVRLSVQFLDTKSRTLKKRILGHMNAWRKTANVEFVETNGIGQVRIARYDEPDDMAGYWSYLGTEILAIPENEPTFNLEGFTTRTPAAEFRRVVRHETGHTLGFDHEHMRSELVDLIDRKKAIEYFDLTEGWTEEETIEQVLTPLAINSIMATEEADPLSVMCYDIPGEITKSGDPIVGGSDITENDYRFAGEVYPKTIDSKKKSSPVEILGSGDGTPSFGAPPSNTLPANNRIRSDWDEEFADDAFHIVVMNPFDPDETGRNKSKGYPSYAQVFASFAGARVTYPMRLKSKGKEPKTAFGRIIATHKRIKNYTNRERGTLPDDNRLMDFGKDLFDTLFQGDIKRLYDEARARQRNRKLDIVFTSMIPWIAELPWEFSYDSVRDSFLATEDVFLLRNVLTAVPADLSIKESGPLRILVAAAQPIGQGRLSVEQELSVIERGFGSLIEAGLAEVQIMPRATPGEIQERLSSERFSIVHFIGHGTFDEGTQEGMLLFEDSQGRTYPLKERSIREIFCQRGVGLVFLNSCQSASGGLADFNKGVAQSLVAHGLPALVANQYSVLDSSATTFAKHFYWSLANGMSIGKASCEARIAVNYSMQGEIIDWAVPAVYARDPNMKFVQQPATRRSARKSLFKATAVEAQERPVKVAFWDIDSVFPALEDTLELMNDAQSTFGFEMTSLSPPIGIWDTENESPDGKPYLLADCLAHRMKNVPVELGVDLIACITRHWMRDEEWLNLYGWWPAKQTPPVMILSVAGFEELAAEGEDTTKVIVNTTVAGLTGFLADVGTHTRGPSNCPLSFNEERDLAGISGQHKFDRYCLKQLKSKIPNELPALQALLNVIE